MDDLKIKAWWFDQMSALALANITKTQMLDAAHAALASANADLAERAKLGALPEQPSEPEQPR